MKLFENLKEKVLTLADNSTYEEDKKNNSTNTENTEKTALLNFLHEVSTLDCKVETITFNQREYKHNTSNSIINLLGNTPSYCKVKTQNIIGFIQQGDYSLNITSRFGSAFLQYMIADSDGFREIEYKGATIDKQDCIWLLAFLWNIKCKSAYRLGLPKAYVTRTQRTAKVHGTIDPVDFFQNKNIGKILCSYREHSYNNLALPLFIQAYNLIKNYSFCASTKNIYTAFVMANQGKRRTMSQMLGTANFSNPYYNEYNQLIYLSKKIVQQQGIGVGIQNKSSAFLFDVSMLFEYFIRKLLVRNNISLRSNKSTYFIPTGGLEQKRRLIPDIIIEHKDGIYIYDVKYKKFDTKTGVKREDLFQIHTYVGQYGNDKPIKGCGFIYPISAHEQQDTQIDDFFIQQGKKIPFHVLFLQIPDSKKDNFNLHMKEQCNLFITKIKNFIYNTIPL